MSNNNTEKCHQTGDPITPPSQIFDGQKWVDPPSGTTSGTDTSQKNTQPFNPR